MRMIKPVLIFISVLCIGGFLGTQYVNYKAFQQANATEQPAEDAVVYNSGWDGSVKQVEDWLNENLNDPKSVESVEWSKVATTEQGNYVVRFKFRARNNSGGMELHNKAFFLSPAGHVLAVSDYDK